MKKLLTITLAVIASYTIPQVCERGSCSEVNVKTLHFDGDEGIQFFTGTWSDALKEAAKENKPVFLDIFATWCGPCKALKKNTFSDKDVAQYFNANFINVELDGEVGDGKALAQQYHIPGYPSLFIMDKNGKLLS